VSDRSLMERALALAARGEGTTHPNPRVGAVVARGGRVEGEGWHRAPGGPHAEAAALAEAGPRARGATLYVTLEPCAHSGRTPPCADGIIAAGVRRVLAACRDPNPLVDGRGLARLRRAGIEVETGLLAAEARELNRAYLHATATGLPFVTLKLAQSLDGRIAARGGRSRWITCERSREAVHRLRAEADAVLVGVGTVLADDPELTARPRGRLERRQPARVVLDPRLRTPLDARVVREKTGRTILLVGREVPKGRMAPYRARGVTIVPLRTRAGRFSWKETGRALAGLGLLAVLAEGGGETAAWLARERAVSRFELFVSPLLLGGDGIPAFAALGVSDPARALRLGMVRREVLGDDLHLTVEPVQDRGRRRRCSPAS
jgi:diaminohydroxyphosphoribosylaminopyrimidine deaminase/5-amino-6-(5-phosphoribosylamino)uracil reductase